MKHNYSVFDAHSDTLCMARDFGASLAENNCHADFSRMSEYADYTQVFACFVSPAHRSRAAERVVELLDAFYSREKTMPKNVHAILSIEGGDGIRSISSLRCFYRLGVRIAALTWNYSNHIASGAYEKDERRGLTQFGAKIVRAMNEIGMLVDVSHLNRRSFFDIAKITSAPMIATHSCSDRLCPHPRNLTDEQFKLIVESGGCVGVNFYPVFLSDRHECGIDDIIRHIDRFMELGGENNVGIGTDFDGVDCLPQGIEGVQDLYKLFDRLKDMGYSDEVIEKITHKNFKRVTENL